MTLPADEVPPLPPRRTPAVREVFLPVTTARLWVGPPWATERPAGKHAIVMDHRAAFGSGNHPTTYGCLTALERFLEAHPGASVLDVGTGTGVLAIAARLLGAGRVLGIDISPEAVAAAGANAALHGVEVEVSLQPLQEVAGTFDLVLANIRPEPLVALASELATRVRQRLVVSGVLPRERAPVEEAFARTGLQVEQAEVIPDFEGRFPLDSPHWLRFEYRPRRG